MGVMVVERRVRTAVIIDDTEEVRLLLRQALERDGDIRIVGEAADGMAGVAAVRRTQPDVVLLDLSMPVMDGLEALPGIRTVSPRTRIIVLSGSDSASMAERAFDRGAHGYLMKGTSPTGILSYVRTLTTSWDRSVPPPRHAAVEHGTAEAVAAQRTPGRTPGGPAGRAADLAPVGLLVVQGGARAGATVGYANPAATALLGPLRAPLGEPLASAVPALALLVERSAPELDLRPEVRDQLAGPHGRLDVTLTRSNGELLVTLHRPLEGDEAARLRQAIATTAHEIRNPVTVLTGIAVMLDEAGLPASAQPASLLAAVRRQAAVLDRVTEDLLTAAQTQRGSLRLDIGPVDLAALLAGVVADLGDAVTVDVRGEQGIQVLADATRLNQMVTNLLSNALKYGAPPYAIEVARSAGWTGPLVHIAVEDSGPGVHEEFRGQLFEEFTRAEDAGARGTGLGLFLVRSLAEAQDGSADYHPRPGGGSVFTVTLPEAGAPARQTGRPDSV